MIKTFTQKEVTHEESGLRLDRYLRLRSPSLPQSVIEKAARKGHIRIEGVKSGPSYRVQEGQTISFPENFTNFVEPLAKKPPKNLTQAERKWIRQAILYEDEDLLVLNKPAGIATQGGTNQSKSMDVLMKAYTQRISRSRVGARVVSPRSVCEYVTEDESRWKAHPNLERRGVYDESYIPRLVHRLDLETSGILVFAKSLSMARWLTNAFKERTVQKVYWALVCKIPQQKEGVISLSLSKKPDPWGERVHIDTHGLKATTHYRVLEERNPFAWLELTPQTGRTHQLRVHCAEGLKTPILGDKKYGGKDAAPFGATSLHLHARELTIPLPQGNNMSFKAPLPQKFQETCQKLGFTLV